MFQFMLEIQYNNNIGVSFYYYKGRSRNDRSLRTLSMTDVIENRNYLAVPDTVVRRRPTRNRRDSIFPQWTELTGSASANEGNSTECKCAETKTITAAEFGLMIATIVIGWLISLFILYLTIRVSRL